MRMDECSSSDSVAEALNHEYWLLVLRAALLHVVLPRIAGSGSVWFRLNKVLALTFLCDPG